MKRLIALSVALTSVMSLAQDMELAQSQAKVPLTSSILSELTPDRISYFSIFTGPSIGSSDPVDEFGNIDQGGISTWNQLSVGWRLNDDLRAIVNPRFVINHNSVDPDSEEYEWDDPVFGVNGTWFKSGNFSFGGGLNTILPVARTEGTREDGIVFNPGGFQSANYMVNSRWNVGAWISGRVLFYDRPLTKEDESFSLMLAPLATYTWSDQLRGTLFYQFNGEGDEQSQVSFTRDESLNAMVSVSLNQYLTLEPILTVFRESDYNFAKANFTMWMSGRLF